MPTQKPIPFDLSSMRQDGMLADLPEGFTAFLEATYGDLCRCMWEINRPLMSLIWSARPTSFAERHSALLLTKLAQTFQAAVLLVERAMPVESQVVGRSALECAIELAACAADPNRADQIRAAGARHDKVYAERIISHLKEQRWWEPGSGIAAMYEQATQTDGSSAKLEDAARIGGTQLLYDALYRGVSGNAAHANHGALMQQLEFDGNEVSIKIGPNFDDIPLAIVIACTAALSGIRSAGAIFNQPGAVQESAALTTKFNALIEPYANDLAAAR